jgi:hypothetical protein
VEFSRVINAATKKAGCMIVKPYKNRAHDIAWFQVSSKKHYGPYNVDLQSEYYGRKGEFNLTADLAFKKHLARIETLKQSDYYKTLNGTKQTFLFTTEPPWYK